MSDATTITVNGEPRDYEALAIDALLLSLGLDPGRPGIAVAVNDEVVPRREWARRAPRPGDRVEVVGAVQGG
jgi:sulfur carrier protein